MDPLALLIGISITIVGMAIMLLTILFLRKNQVKNIIVGGGFTFVGVAMMWLSFQGNDTFYFDMGLSDAESGYLLAGFVLSLFILKGVFEIRAGVLGLKHEDHAALRISKSKLQIMIAAALTGFALLMLALLFAAVL